MDRLFTTPLATSVAYGSAVTTPQNQTRAGGRIRGAALEVTSYPSADDGFC